MKIIKIQNMRLLIMALITFSVAMLVSCSPGSETGTEQKGVVFYSAAKPGPWESQAADHETEITVTRAKDYKTINVNVPFAKNNEKNHYVEAIVILDLERKELKKMSFEKGKGSKNVKFDFPASFNTPVYVVMKCNKHDMWEKLVDWSE
jgi:desulfoferrodoxin (superoxide reductase-like protein)